MKLINLNMGFLKNQDGEQKDVVVQTNEPVPVLPLVVGTASIVLGIACLVNAAFENGANKSIEAEYQTMKDLHIVD